MTGFLLVKFIKFSPLIQVAVLVVGATLSYVTAVSRGDVSLYLPFISETGAFSPEMCIFSLCLILGSFIGCIFTAVRYLIILQNPDESLKQLNFYSFIVGITAMFGLAGVAAFPMTTVLAAHLAVAALYFVGSAFYFFLATYMTWKIEGRSKLLFFRCLLILLLGGSLLMLVIFFPIALKRWYELNDIMPALKTPENKGFAMVLLAAVFEWSSEILICLFNLTFILDFKNHGLLLTITPVKSSSTALETSTPPTEVAVEK